MRWLRAVAGWATGLLQTLLMQAAAHSETNRARPGTGESSLDKQLDNKFCNDTAHAHATHMDLRCTVVISRTRRLCSNRQQAGLVLHGDAGDDGCVVLEVQGVGGGNAPHLHGKNEPETAASTMTHDSHVSGG